MTTSAPSEIRGGGPPCDGGRPAPGVRAKWLRCDPRGLMGFARAEDDRMATTVEGAEVAVSVREGMMSAMKKTKMTCAWYENDVRDDSNRDMSKKRRESRHAALYSRCGPSRSGNEKV